MSVPPSSKCVAKLCRSECRLTRFLMPAASATTEIPQLLATMAGEDTDEIPAIPEALWKGEQAQSSPTHLPENGVDLRAHLTHIERSLISQALQRSGGTVAHAARLLSLRRTTLVEKLRKLGMASADA